jgi:uncharacterized protein (TIGR02284 family)
MQRRADHDIKILNSLIETTLDSADGYSRVATSAADARQRELFQEWANDRRQVVTELQSQVRVLGGKPDADSVPAAAQRMFLKLLDRLSQGDESIVAEVERGEDFMQEKYEEALGDEELSCDVRNAVVRAFSSVKSGHDRARDLRAVTLTAVTLRAVTRDS